jgi:hypothetical protein
MPQHDPQVQSDALDMVYGAIDRQHADKSATTRRRFVAGAGATLGSMGLLAAMPGMASAAKGDNSPENILNIAATAEVLATIVNTVGPEKVALDDVTKLNVQAAAREELIHYQALTSALGATALTTTIYVPDEVFASKESLLNTLVVGDQIFVNAYLLGTTVFARTGKNSKQARYAAEIMGVEAVHRALALQSLGQLGNDRAYMEFTFKNIKTAVTLLEGAGFGFGKAGSKPGTAYTFEEVSQRTPNPPGVNTLSVA